DRGDVFGHVHPDPGDEPEGPGVGPQYPYHLGDGVGQIVAARSAVVRQPAGDGQRARVVRADPQRVAHEVHRGPEAGVEVEVGDVVDTDTGCGQCDFRDLVHR